MGEYIKVSRQLLPSLARTATNTSVQQKGVSDLAVRAYLNVTDASGDGGLTVLFLGFDPASGNPVALSAGGTPIFAPGTYVYEMTPYVSQDGSANSASGNVMESVSRMVPFQWAVQVAHADDSPYTYSLAVEIGR